MSSNLSTKKLIELLDQLKTALESFAARSDRLNSDCRAKTAREGIVRDKLLRDHESAMQLQLAEMETNTADQRARQQARCSFRKDRIGRAFQNSKEAGLNEIEQAVGAKRYELQRRMIQAERDRDAGYAAAAARLEGLRASFLAGGERLDRAEIEARRRFRGYGMLRRRLSAAPGHANAPTGPEEALLSELEVVLAKAEGRLSDGRGILIAVFRFLPLWIALAVVPVGIAVFGRSAGLALDPIRALGTGVGLLALAFIGRFLAVKSLRPHAIELADALGHARHLRETGSVHAEEAYKTGVEAVRQQFIATSRNAEEELRTFQSGAGHKRVSCRMNADERAIRAASYHEKLSAVRAREIETAYQDTLANLTRSSEVKAATIKAACEKRVAEITTAFGAEWQGLEAEWSRTVPPVLDVLMSASDAADRLFPAWDKVRPQGWVPPRQFANAAKYGALHADLAKLCSALPSDKRLSIPGSRALELPLCLTFPGEGSVVFETTGVGADKAVAALNNIVLRLLFNSPPGRVHFTILDPVGLGQNFAGIMHLADYEEQIINSRIWTQPAQIEEKLAQTNEHMEKVIQMYLRNEYATIAEYNEQAGVIAEKYHFLVVADFPHGFTDTAARRLLSIAASGPRCGVYALIHWDRRQPLPQDFPAADLRQAGLALVWRGAEFGIVGRPQEGVQILLDPPPPAEKATDLIHVIGQASRDSSRVEVPFDHITPADSEMWSLDTSAELRVAIGRTGATKLQYLSVGKGTRQHGLITGKTGSGKSTLFHVLITNLALWCGPDQVEFYLVDFKKGVEFKCYATRRLPHARVVAIESDREFGLSVLQRVDDELRRRGEMFRKLGVQDIPGYKRAGGSEPIPRTLLLIDEFQEFFVEDDKIAQTASLLLDRIVRQGRAFGIHVLLGSQTLGGAYTVARTTLGQMVIRIALQCNEADAYLIFEDDNPAPRLLSRPGEAIYNDAAGAVEGNSPFQIVWLPDEVRDRCLEKVRARASAEAPGFSGPIVFEGNSPSEARENEMLRTVLEKPATVPASAPWMWMGAPNSIKGPTGVVFKRQSGNNLLIVGQREETVLGLLTTGVVGLSAQFPRGAARVIFLDSSAPGSAEREYVGRILADPPRNVQVARPGDLQEIMAALAADRAARASGADAEAAPPVFLIIHGLHRFPKLRFEDDFSFGAPGGEASPGAALNELVTEGTRLGLHVIASCDTYNNVTRFLSRKAISEFEMRVVFQMSVNDSASLIDNPKAGALGLHRALLFNAQEGWVETFRPYALPDVEWLAAMAATLR